jgi:hypothetical protein
MVHKGGQEIDNEFVNYFITLSHISRLIMVSLIPPFPDFIIEIIIVIVVVACILVNTKILQRFVSGSVYGSVSVSQTVSGSRCVTLKY